MTLSVSAAPSADRARRPIPRRTTRWLAIVLLGLLTASPSSAASSHAAVAVPPLATKTGAPLLQTTAPRSIVDGPGAQRPAQGCGIGGTAYEMGEPRAGIALSLIEYEPAGVAQTLIASAVSGPGGRYAFRSVPALRSGAAYYVSFTGTPNPGAGDARLSAWFGPDITTFARDGCVDDMDLDVADAPLGSPDDLAEVPWGTPFTWNARTKAWNASEDRYRVCFAPPEGGIPFDCAPAQGVSGSSFAPLPTDRPASVDDGVAYGWLLRIERPDGAFGFGRWQHRVTFVPVTPTVPTPVETTPVPVTPDPSATVTPRPTVHTATPDPQHSPTPTKVPTEPIPEDALRMCPGDTLEGRMDIFLPETPAVADVLFLFDTTGSMSDVIDRVRRESQAVMSGIAGIIPDVEFGVATFGDYPSLAGAGNVPYRLVQPITADRAAVQAALGAIPADNGGYALNEAYTRGLYESYRDPQVGWRQGVRSYVILFGDTMPYDDDLNEGIANPMRNPGGRWCHSMPRCHRDPGRDDRLGTGDDLDLQEVLDALAREGITLFTVAALEPTDAWSPVMLAYWNEWARRVNPGGRAELLGATSNLPQLIEDLIRGSGTLVGRVVLDVQPPQYAGWVTVSPPEHTNVLVPRGGHTVTFNYTIRIPLNAALDTTHEIVLEAFADNAPVGRKTVRIHLSSADCVPPPTVQPSGHFVIGLPHNTNRNFAGTHIGGGRTIRRGGPASGWANSAIQIQNLDGSQTLNAWAYLFPQMLPYVRPANFGRPPAFPKEVFGVPPGASYNLFLPLLDLPYGQYTAVLLDEISLPLAGISRTDWTETGAAVAYSNVSPSYELIVPLVVREYYGQSSIIAVMSDDNRRPVTVEMTFFREGSAIAVSSHYFELDAYEGATFDMEDDDPAFHALGPGFVGSARLRLVYGEMRRTDEGAQIGAMSFVNMRGSPRAVWSFEAVPVGRDNEHSSETLFAPLWRSRQHGTRPGDRLDTGISVVNPGEQPVEAEVELFTTTDPSASASCRAAGRILLPARTIPPRSSQVFYQGPVGGVTGLPDDCFGSAVIRSLTPGGKLLAIVNDAMNLRDYAAAYNAVPVERAHTKVAVPLMRSEHGAYKLTTGIQVMNTGERDARVHIDFIDGIGPGALPVPPPCRECDAVVGPNQSHTWWPPHIGSIDADTYGSAIIRSDVPVAVIVNDFPLAGQVDAATYNGIPVFATPVANPTVRPRH